MATHADLVPRQPLDLIVRVAVEAGALLAVATAIMSPSLPSPFPFLELVLLLAVAAASRWFGLALSGNGFASFVLGVVLYAILSGGWSFGELLWRRLSLSAAGVNVGHPAVGSTLSGLVDDQLGASMGRRR